MGVALRQTERLDRRGRIPSPDQRVRARARDGLAHGARAGQFVEQAAAAGLGAPARPTGAVAADFDGDGRLDLYDGERIWRNTLALGNGHVEVSVVGPWAGSRLTLTTPDGVRQVRVPDSSALPVHFGLGNAASAQLEVRFGNGQTTMRSVAPGDRIRVSVP